MFDQTPFDFDIKTKQKIIIGSEAEVPKSLVDMEKLKKLLTVISVDTGYGNYEVKMYRELMDTVIIPRYYALKIFKSRPDVEFEYRLSEGNKVRFPEFVGALRPVQQDFSQETLAAIKDPFTLGGIVNFAVGTGKTVYALWLASQLGLKTLVIVHKEFLMDQWVERILGNPAKGIPAFLPGAKVGRIQQSVCDVEGKHIVLGMVHSLAMKDDYPASIYDEFGLIIIDESHHMSSPLFSQAIPKFNAKYRIGLSATPKRKDGTENVFLYNVGPIVAKYSVENLAPVIKRVFLDEVKFKEGFNSFKVPMGRIVTFVAKHQKRNMAIAGQITAAVKAGRKSIIMTDRLEQLDILKDYITSILMSEGLNLKYSIGKYVGGMKQAALDNTGEKDIILSTYQMGAEALDIPALDTIFLVTPKSDVLQSVGRILRTCDGKKQPIVVDIVDRSIPLFIKMYEKRMKLYKTKGWIA
jgi:superfamily II DNA or RNA helicase